MNTALLEAERRIQAFKADGAATRVFAESEQVDGKGASRTSISAPPLALSLITHFIYLCPSYHRPLQ